MPTPRSILSGFAEIIAPIGCPACNDHVHQALEFCDACASQLEVSDHPCAGHVHIGPMAQAIKRFKYEGRSELAVALACTGSERLLDLVGHVDCIAPVPVHRARRIERGYDQAALLARAYARIAGVRFHLDALTRVRSTGKQVGRTREARLAAMRGAFVAQGIEGLRVLLVDDVVTTGATFDAAEVACREAGASEVHRIAVAAAPA